MISFREIMEEDNPIIAYLIRYNLKNNGLDVPGTVYFDKEIDYLSKVYGKNGSKYYVAVDETGKVVGGIGFAAYTNMVQTGEIQKLYLDDSVKGAGLSYKLIALIEDKMREAGYKHAYIETHKNLKAAIHIYEKLGYKPIPRPAEVQHGTMTHFYLKDL